MLDVQSKLDSFDRGVKRRDWIEIGAAIIVIPLFSYEVYRQPNYLAKFGAIWIVVYVLYVIYRLLNVKKNKPEALQSYLEYLKQSKEYLEKQKRLIDRVLYWYILPGLMGAFVMMIGILDLPSKSWQEIIRIEKIWKALAVFAFISLFIYLLNKWSIKKEFIPRIKKVNELIDLMEEEK